MVRVLFLLTVLVSIARGETSILDRRIAFLLGMHSPYAHEHALNGFFPDEENAAARFEAISNAVLRDDPKKRWRTAAEIRAWLDRCHAAHQYRYTDVLNAAFAASLGDELSIRMAYLAGAHARHAGRDELHITDRKKAGYVLSLLSEMNVSIRLRMVYGIPGGTTIIVSESDENTPSRRFYSELETIEKEL